MSLPSPALPDSPEFFHDVSLDTTIAWLRAAGEQTRMRLLVLLCKSDLTVSDLTEILGQSQPRISRHLRLLVEAGLAERYQEGAWAYFRGSDRGNIGAFNRFLIRQIDANDPMLNRDAERLDAVRQKRLARAAKYFSRNAANWDTLRSLHAPEERVEQAMTRMVGDRKFGQMLDIGTGTGRILELFAPLCERAIGLDGNHDMLSYARTNLEQAGVANSQVRHGDAYQLPQPRHGNDLITIHQVLHFLDNPALAIAEAARALAPSGLMLIVDFAPHELEFLRDEHAHVRLGFSRQQVIDWLETAGLEIYEVCDVAPLDGDQQKLTVTLWLARDKNVLMAANRNQQQELVT